MSLYVLCRKTQDGWLEVNTPTNDYHALLDLIRKRQHCELFLIDGYTVSEVQQKLVAMNTANTVVGWRGRHAIHHLELQLGIPDAGIPGDRDKPYEFTPPRKAIQLWLKLQEKWHGSDTQQR